MFEFTAPYSSLRYPAYDWKPVIKKKSTVLRLAYSIFGHLTERVLTYIKFCLPHNAL